MPDFYDAVPAGVNQTERNKILNKALSAPQEPYLSKIKLYGDIALYDTANTVELTLNTIDANNVVWVVSDIEGWWNLPEPEFPDLPRGWGDGAYDAVGRYASRIMTLTGSFLTQSASDAPAARQALLQALHPMTKNQGGCYLIATDFENSIAIVGAQEGANAQFVTYTTSVDLENGPLLSVGDRIVIEGVSPSDFNKSGSGYPVTAVSDNTVTVDRGDDGDYSGGTFVEGGLLRKIVKRTASKVRLSGTPVITNTNARGRHDFSVGLKAVDPIKYEFVAGDPDGYDTEVLTAGVSGTASASITNSGDVAVPIIIEISANLVVANSSPGSCPRIQIGDYYMDIVAGTDTDVRLEIDTYNREALKVTYDGAAVDLVENGRSNLAVLVDWLYLQPGANTVTLARFPQGTTCTVYYRSGWIS